MPNGGVDLLRSLGSIKIKALSIYIFTRVLIRPGLKHDLNKSTPPVGTEVSEQLAYTNRTRPFFGWALILQAITPSAKKEVWPHETNTYVCLFYKTIICVGEPLNRHLKRIHSGPFFGEGDQFWLPKLVRGDQFSAKIGPRTDFGVSARPTQTRRAACIGS